MLKTFTEAKQTLAQFDLELDDYHGKDKLFDISYHNDLMFPNATTVQVIHIARLLNHAHDKALTELTKDEL